MKLQHGPWLVVLAEITLLGSPEAHRILEWFELEGSLQIILLQPHYHGQEHLPLNQVAQRSKDTVGAFCKLTIGTSPVISQAVLPVWSNACWQNHHKAQGIT